MIRRCIVIVLNGVGLGALPDAEGDREGAIGALGHAFAAKPEVTLSTLEALGLGHIAPYPQLRRMDQPEGCFGRLIRQSPGSDAMTAWWELAGAPVNNALPSYRGELPETVRRLVERVAQCGTTVPRSDVPEEMLVSGVPHAARERKILVWGDAGGTCYLGAHESLLTAKDLFRLAREVRTATGEAMGIWRVGARPFAGGAGSWHWAEGWRDSCVPLPTKSVFEHLLGAEQLVTGFGKCGDFFNGKGFTRSIPIESTARTWSDLLTTLSTTPRGLIVVGLFDDLVRLPRKQFPSALAEQLGQFDTHLRDLQRLLKPDDCVCVMSDQSRDVHLPHYGSREYAPLLVFGPKLARGVNLGDRTSYADLGQTIAEAFDAAELSVGESFLSALRSG